MLRGLQLLGVSAILVLSPAVFAQEQTVQNLGKIPAAIKHKEGRQHYREQMDGVDPQRDALMDRLPNGLDAQSVREMLGADQIALKRWPHYRGRYIAIGGDQGGGFVVAVIEHHDKGKSQLVARSSRPLKLQTTWHQTQLLGPTGTNNSGVGLEADASVERISAGGLVRFDLARYEVAAGVYAFGVVSSIGEGYSGGGATFESLHLFLAQGKEVTNVLSQPVYYFIDSAGDWNKDGTRQHHLSEGKNILVMLPSVTDGYRDISIKSTRSRWQKTFFWSGKNQRYEAR